METETKPQGHRVGEEERMEMLMNYLRHTWVRREILSQLVGDMTLRIILFSIKSAYGCL